MHQPPGVLAPAEPEQFSLEPAAKGLRYETFVLRPRATYRITARLLRSERYRFDDGAALAPLDFAVGWGPMSDSSVLDALDIGQSARFFHLSWRDPPIEPEAMLRHAANMHLIPADRGVERTLEGMRRGQVIRLEGWLVDATRDDGWRWDTSLTRGDNGDGACELMLVESATVVTAVP